jgi:uroporphyrinogen III methyltransferase/synthase
MGRLAGKRVLVPPSRAEGNPLAGLLRREGAEVVEFPTIAPELPTDVAALDHAARGVARYDWVLFTGTRSAANFLDRVDAGEAFPARIATLGGGAAAEARRRGLEISYRPVRHVAADVAAGWPDPEGRRILLVRAEGATEDLPEALRARGAEVDAIAGYRMTVSVEPGAAAALAAAPPAIVALPNGTAVRYLVRGLGLAGLSPADLADARVAAVGEATAQIAREHGFASDLVAEGRIADLVRALG